MDHLDARPHCPTDYLQFQLSPSLLNPTFPKAADSAGNGPILCNCSALMLPSSPRYQNIKTSDRWVSSTLGVATGSSLTATILLWLALQSSCSFPFQMSLLLPDAVLDLGRIQVVMALQGAEVGKIITISSFCLIGGSSFTC